MPFPKFGSLPPGTIPEDVSAWNVSATMLMSPHGFRRFIAITPTGGAVFVKDQFQIQRSNEHRVDDMAPRLVNSTSR